VESYLKYNGNNFTRRFDANSYLYVTKAMDYFDLSQPTGSLAAAFVPARRRSSISSSASPATGFTRPITARSWCARSMPSGADVTYLDIESTWGHDAFLLEVDTMTRLLAGFLNRLSEEEGIAGP
jgi:homoserine O-acetyltransferase